MKSGMPAILAWPGCAARLPGSTQPQHLARRASPLAGWEGSPQSPTEVDMGLSRKRQRELKRLKRSAEELRTSSATPSSTRAPSCATRDARPRTSHAKRSALGAATLRGSAPPRGPRRPSAPVAPPHPGARDRLTDDVVPAITGALGSALAASRGGQGSAACARSCTGSRAPANVRASCRCRPSPGTGPLHPDRPRCGRLAGIAYAAWQTLRADDDLWIEDLDEISADDAGAADDES